MELQLFKETFEKNLEELTEHLESIKYKIFTPEDEELKDCAPYADAAFEDFYKRAYIDLTNAECLVDKIYKFIVSDSEKPGCPEKPAAQSELFNFLENFSEGLRIIDERLDEVYSTLTGIGSEEPDASYNLNSIDGYTNFLLNKISIAITWTNKILDFLTFTQEVDECSPAAKEERASSIITDRLDYCD